jgi:hypothetical protein
MKQTIKRTEITIETVEITTIRRIRPEVGGDPEDRAGAGTTVMLSGSAGAVELIKQDVIAEKRKNDDAR